MPIYTEITVSPDFIDDNSFIRSEILKAIALPEDKQIKFKIIKRSIDSRGKFPKYLLKIEVYMEGEDPEQKFYSLKYPNVFSKKQVLIIGAGPSGYFCALELIENGLKPIILERGKDVISRTKDILLLKETSVLNPESNFCFGEGGAGAYSDGKLYTRSTKRGNIAKVLKIFVDHGANPDILIDAHPHIGSDKLPQIVKRIRETILSHGGDIYFNTKVTDFIIKNETIIGVRSEDDREFYGEAVVLATGHSAHDIFELLYKKGIFIKAKPFALGVRIEHPQSLIDEIQYHHTPRHNKLPAASYRLVCQVERRGVFSFCMCPGGFIVPTSTDIGEIVINGMSLSNRDSMYANSGIVVEVKVEDTLPYTGELSSLSFQKGVEKKAYRYNPQKNLKAPAQRMIDFVKDKVSPTIPDTSYFPGVFSADFNEILPKNVSMRLKRAFVEFGSKMRGYYTNEATLLAVESRTSSPVKIPRLDDSLMHPQIKNLYPCGEGSGYAGGIVSCAIDGQKVARCINTYRELK
ncbi:MAG: FAD-binding protein [Desulfobacterales bacterium]|nr:FAD-binding protein [Desulfobacterales bacterium]MBF0395195.1 FAD-binding protein [Desulfobacterales bacterium]